MKLSREWATPLTIGAFCLMAITGILMFFHLDRGLNKLAHEWLGWLMVLGVVAHAAVNWPSFKRYFHKGKVSRSILVMSALVIAGSFLSLPGTQSKALPAPYAALNGITHAPLSKVALLVDKPVEELMVDLQQAGIQINNPDQSLSSLLKKDRELNASAMSVIFQTEH